jgi:hypothetical protein
LKQKIVLLQEGLTTTELLDEPAYEVSKEQQAATQRWLKRLA